MFHSITVLVPFFLSEAIFQKSVWAHPSPNLDSTNSEWKLGGVWEWHPLRMMSPPMSWNYVRCEKSSHLSFYFFPPTCRIDFLWLVIFSSKNGNFYWKSVIFSIFVFLSSDISWARKTPIGICHTQNIMWAALPYHDTISKTIDETALVPLFCTWSVSTSLILILVLCWHTGCGISIDHRISWDRIL